MSDNSQDVCGRPPRDVRMQRLLRNQDGAVAVEFGLVGGVFILALMAILDFGTAFWQWNQATKALQLGARLAAVTDPVSSDLKTFDGLQAGGVDGGPMPAFERRCSGATQTCTNGTYDAGALQTLVYGRGNTTCPATRSDYPGMCQIFPRVRPENLVVEYVQTGLGTAGRRAIPTITLRFVNLNYDFVILNRMLGLPTIAMAGLATSVTAEDLSGR